LAEAYAAYQAAPRGTNAQRDAVNDFIAAAKARNPSTSSASSGQAGSGQAGVFLDPKPFLLFAAFGPAGRDGRTGTADDLTDPFAAHLRQPPVP
jgi:hypothetical protein